MSAFIKASSFALQNQPVFNAVIDDLEICYRDYVDISVAVATPKVRKIYVNIFIGIIRGKVLLKKEILCFH